MRKSRPCAPAQEIYLWAKQSESVWYKCLSGAFMKHSFLKSASDAAIFYRHDTRNPLLSDNSSNRSSLTGINTAFTKASTLFSVIFPGSQKAFLSSYRTRVGESRKSIFELGSDNDILDPWSPGTTLFIR